MKTIVTKRNKPKRNYPWIGEYVNESNDYYLVLFTERGKGLLLKTSSAYSIEYSEIRAWSEENYKQFSGTVELENS